MERRPNYVLVTAARNARKTIGRTIDSICEQSLPPIVWCIVSDSSDDGTDKLVERAANRYKFISPLRVERAGGYSFMRKVAAIRMAEALLERVPHEYFGILDADIEIAPDYYESMIREFEMNPSLGIAGGEIVQVVDRQFERRIKSRRSVAGAIQLFRRQCYRDCGGLVPLRYGGEDAAAEIRARMKDWEVRTFDDHVVLHQGVVGAREGSRLRSRFRWGQMNFHLGYAPSFELTRCVYRVRDKPILLGSLAELLGFVVTRLRDGKPSLSPEVVEFLRAEQRGELRRVLSGE